MDFCMRAIPTIIVITTPTVLCLFFSCFSREKKEVQAVSQTVRKPQKSIIIKQKIYEGNKSWLSHSLSSKTSPHFHLTISEGWTSSVGLLLGLQVGQNGLEIRKQSG
jgi:hypothetical protein